MLGSVDTTRLSLLTISGQLSALIEQRSNRLISGLLLSIEISNMQDFP
jgi:hypothetical protein